MGFSGAKIALLFEDRIVIYLRDDKPDIPFPGQWDFPGGGREGDETPDECALRETEEEFGIRIAPEAIIYRKVYPSVASAPLLSHFMVARVTEEQVAAIRFGDEGQRWELVTVSEMLSREGMIPRLRQRFQEFLATYQT